MMTGDRGGGMSMPALSLYQPWCQFLVTRQPCEMCDDFDHLSPVVPHPMVKRFETRSWPCPPSLIGQRMAFAATLREPEIGIQVGDYRVAQMRPDARDPSPPFKLWANARHLRHTTVADPLPLGAIVGSGVVAACYPIVAWEDAEPDPPYVSVVTENTLDLVTSRAPEPGAVVDISDQLPYGDWTPGRYAWLIEDAAPTTERCPWCWGSGDEQGSEVDSGIPVAIACETCNGAGRCEPIPAKGRQRIWRWTPEAAT